MSKLNSIEDAKLYELALNTRLHIEERRDDINNFYVALFAAMISLAPIIPNIADKNNITKIYTINLIAIILSVMGIALSVNWIFSLKRIVYTFNGIEKFIISLEKKYDKKFIRFLNEYLDRVDAPEKIEKQELLVPYLFTVLFSLTLTFSIIYCFII